jgi:hypothetical protein
VPEQTPDIFRTEALAHHARRQGVLVTLPEQEPGWTRWGYVALLALCAAFIAGLFMPVEVQPLPTEQRGPYRERLIELLFPSSRLGSEHAGR